MAFPTTSILDSFTRANETPLGNGTWSGPIFSGGTQFRLVSNVAMAVVGAADSYNGSYWSVNAFSADQEAFVTVNASSGTPFTGGPIVWLRVTNPNTGSMSGYDVQMTHGSTGLLDTYFIERWDNAAYGATLKTNSTASTLSAGDKFGASAVGNTITLYIKIGAGAWTAIDSVTDNTYLTGGYIGLAGGGGDGENWNGIDFGGGAVVTPELFVPSILQLGVTEMSGRQYI